jgi:hypothetical protein
MQLHHYFDINNLLFEIKQKHSSETKVIVYT